MFNDYLYKTLRNVPNASVPCLLQYFPFPEKTNLYSISASVLVEGRINCKSCESGIYTINRVVCDFVKIKQSDKTKSLTVMTIVVGVDEELLPLNSTSAFHRISLQRVGSG